MTAATPTDEPMRLVVVGTTAWVEPAAAALSARESTTVERVETAAAALDAVRGGTVDCLLAEHALDGTTGIELLETVRAETETLPVVIATASGSEAIASDAVAAGAADYVPLDAPDEAAADGAGETAIDDLAARTERAVRSARKTATRRERARQFDAVFDDERTATWVLDETGALVRANRRAHELLDDGVDAAAGEPFWTLPWWSESAALRTDIRRIVETALAGSFGNAVVSQPTDGANPRVIDLSVRPVEDERGDLASIVVEGVDISERVGLERELRRSEELHRVTLNNMTDTVLITDEDGEYTYVCPNVHFIFGYTAEEIRERGTIDDLLGEDLFDREELAAEGVLKNIECTATDKAGREHTLLVNVREVSIQGGRLLYSCRDVTKRKRREDALATLQETAREFLYAGTHQEIAEHVVDSTPGVLGVDASAVYLFDADANDLQPAAHSPAMAELNGPLPTVHADGAALPSYSFVEDEPLFFDNVHGDDRLENRATELRSTAYIPLGDHGVFVAGSSAVGAFGQVDRELADLLAATAEAALDRVDRESRLREQDRRLQQQNERLSELNRVNETIREIDHALVQAETREEIDHTVCELLTGDDRFAFAWIGAVDRSTGTIEPRAWAGDGQGYLDSQSFELTDGGAEPAVRTAATGEATLISNVADGLREEPWRKDALVRDYLSALSIPLRYNEITHGVLTVYAESRDAFDETARAVLVELGETIASALSAIERKNALLTTAMTRVEFEVDDDAFVLSRLARDAECTLSYHGGVRQTAEGSHVFVTVDDAAVEAVERAAADLLAVEDVRSLGADGESGVLRLGLAEPFLALELADHGAVVREVTAEPDGTTLIVDVPESIDVRTVTGIVEGSFADVELRAKQSIDRSSEGTLSARFLDELTDRQLEVVQTAYYSGYFESPRDSTGEDVAAALDISPPAFYQHVRTAQRKLFATLFAEGHLSMAAGAEVQ
ncbi:PAS domain S-box-containing protein [Natronoarchaeum philippinense]|uniref:PAS domain S-box-containing protein n=1 Tax=Natronoarchaeum philippinense TaxID=558529 RepID=A0A285P885_NATPI|nr:bacterio-opsin activator domain-containing protein [Natronoarchaeum philippinense]SNZ17934.1 PAS domain S-box-containing protein [Natronoarchaeum philippinense]